VEDLATFGFELLRPFLDVELRIEELVVDTRFDAGVLTEGECGEEAEEGGMSFMKLVRGG
jgi:hypothetical protein